MLMIESFLTLYVFFYISSLNLFSMLTSAGLYLIFIGFFLFINDIDIYVGFLWVIDLGVGLVFFIFIIHFSTFFYQKSSFNLIDRYFINILSIFFIYFYYLYSNPNISDNYFIRDLNKTWFFNVNHVDYYSILNFFEVTELNLLHNTYFLINSFVFYIVNNNILFTLITVIIMVFSLKRSFSIMNFSQIINNNALSNINSSFFIRQQNFIKQQNTTGIVRVWIKNKKIVNSV